MNPQITNAVKEFVTDDDKTDLFTECYDAVKFMMDHDISLEDARYTVKNVVRAVRHCYDD
jgi:hypothetical protein